jgi:DNA-binding transcriptional MocR family regulator
MEITGEDVTIVNGTQQGLDLVARTLLAPGDQVAVEDPGYRMVRWLFESLGTRINSPCLKSKTSLPENVLTLRLVYGDGHAEAQGAAGAVVVRN